MAAEAAQEATQYPDTPEGWAARWRVELATARKELERWHRQGAEVVKQFLDERDDLEAKEETRWNLFSANVLTQQATLYGQTPRVSVSRRFADAKDDVARVAAEMLERLLNSDIEKGSDCYAQALQYALEDRLLPGLGLVRVRYEVETETVEGTPAILNPDGTEKAPAVPDTEQVSYECVETDYVHWRDVLWSPARVWHEVRWVAFRAYMSREQLVERFGKEVGSAVPLAKQPTKDEDGKETPTPWARAEVWEVWDEETRRVFWLVEGHPRTLDDKSDPLGLDGFFPCPRPLLANPTTSCLVPRPDFALAQDLYREVNELSTRIKLLMDAVRAAGAYDRTAAGLQQLLDGSKRNILVPVENWAAFAEKGGLRGVIDWMPLDQVVAALTSLRDYRREVKDALYEVTGMADIMRGASDPTETARAQGIKAKFGSVRLQRMQDEFARFASDVQRLKSEIIGKHFRPESILEASNVMQTPDAQLAQQAVELLKSRMSAYRIEVKPEAVSLTDFAALKSERMEVVTALSNYLTAAAPAAQSMPGSVPFLLELLQAMVAGLRGSSTMEGVLDRAIAQAQQQAAQPKGPAGPDPKLLATQMKVQGDMQKEQAKLQGDLMRINAEAEANERQEQVQRRENVLEAAQKAQVQAAFRPQQPQRGPGGPGGMP